MSLVAPPAPCWQQLGAGWCGARPLQVQQEDDGRWLEHVESFTPAPGMAQTPKSTLTTWQTRRHRPSSRAGAGSPFPMQEPRLRGQGGGGGDAPRAQSRCPSWGVRSGRRWPRSDVFSRFASDPSYGTRRSSVRSRQGCRPAILHGERRGPCSTSNRAGIRRGVRAGYVPQVGKVAAASPSGRLTTRSARRRWLERRRCAGPRSSSPR